MPMSLLLNSDWTLPARDHTSALKEMDWIRCNTWITPRSLYDPANGRSHAFKSWRVTTSWWRQRYSRNFANRRGCFSALKQARLWQIGPTLSHSEFSPPSDYRPSIGCPQHFLRPFVRVHIGCHPSRLSRSRRCCE